MATAPLVAGEAHSAGGWGAAGGAPVFRGQIVTAEAAARVHLTQRGDGQTEQILRLGAPRWLNTLQIVGAAAIHTVEVQDLDGAWQPYAATIVAGSGESWIFGEAVHAQAVRLVTPADPEKPDGRGVIQIIPRLEQTDLDDSGDGGGNTFFYEYVVNYAGTGQINLPACDDDAWGLRDELDDAGWAWAGYGNSSAWEEDWKRSASGGTEGTYPDARDFAYFAGHGNSTSFIFGNQTRDDCCVSTGDASGAWGDGDLEWVALAVCQTLTSDGGWANAMDGLHLICGAVDNIADAEYGEDFGERLVSTWFLDGATRVKTAWFETMDRFMGSGVDIRVIGENSTMGNDYIWGEGTVAADPVVDCCYTRWNFVTTSDSDGEEHPSALIRYQHQAQPPVENPVVFDANADSSESVEVIVSANLLAANGGLPATATLFRNITQPATEQTVAAIAERLCGTGQQLCGAQIATNPSGDTIHAVDGPIKLRVCRATRAIELTDERTWLTPRAAPPRLLSASQAVETATGFLTAWGQFPTGAQVAFVDFIRQADVDRRSGEELAASSFNLAQRVVFRRTLGPAQTPVFGPGGELNVILGDNGQLLRTARHGYRMLQPEGTVTLLPLTRVLGDLAALGPAITIGNVRTPVRSIQVDDVQFGYYEQPCAIPQQWIRPTAHLLVTLTDTAGNRSGATLDIHVDAPPLAADVVAPVDGVRVRPGAEVCFNGRVNGGIPPYSVRWNDATTETPLGTTLNPCAALQLSISPERYLALHTITLSATDARGETAHATVEVRVTLPGDTNCDGRVDFNDINPFVVALVGQAPYDAQFPACDYLQADVDGDNLVTFNDIGPFVQALVAGG